MAAEQAEPAPANLAYVSYLLAATSTGSYAEGVGAVLPCYWIYWEVGKELVRRGSPDPRYQKWIDTYGGEEFGDVVRAVIDVTDETGPGPRRRPNGTGCTGTSVPPAATSGCSGTWATARKPGPSDPGRRGPASPAPRAGRPPARFLRGEIQACLRSPCECLPDWRSWPMRLCRAE